VDNRARWTSFVVIAFEELEDASSGRSELGDEGSF
jgi:hypothetical protein